LKTGSAFAFQPVLILEPMELHFEIGQVHPKILEIIKEDYVAHSR